MRVVSIAQGGGKKRYNNTCLLHETRIGEQLRRARVGGELGEQVGVAEHLPDAHHICAVAALIRSYTRPVPVSE